MEFFFTRSIFLLGLMVVRRLIENSLHISGWNFDTTLNFTLLEEIMKPDNNIEQKFKCDIYEKICTTDLNGNKIRAKISSVNLNKFKFNFPEIEYNF